MSVEKLRGILVGLGTRGQRWIDVIKASEDVELVGYVEPVDTQRQSVAEKYGISSSKLFSSLSDAIKGVEADFVLDITPPSVHHLVAEEALAAGLHVMEEKPLSDTFENAVRIVRAAQQAGRIHMVTQQRRFGIIPRATRKALQDGVIGNPEVAVVAFYAAWATRPGSFYTEMPYPMLTDMGVHHFDLIRYVLGREPIRVRAQSWNPSWGWHKGDAGHTAVMEFEGGLYVTHHALGASVGRSDGGNGDWRIEGPNGSLTWEKNELWHTRSYPRDQRVRNKLAVDELVGASQGAVEQTSVLKEFASAVREGREPECSGRDNIRTLALTLAAVQSAKEDRTVEIAEFLQEVPGLQSA